MQINAAQISKQSQTQKSPHAAGLLDSSVDSSDCQWFFRASLSSCSTS